MGEGEVTYARLGVLVAALVKIGEEAEEEDAVTADPPDKGLGVVAIDEEQLESVHHNGDELNLITTWEGTHTTTKKLLMYGCIEIVMSSRSDFRLQQPLPRAKGVHRSRAHIFMRRQGKLSTKLRQTTDRTAVPVDHIDFPGKKHQFAASGGQRVWSESKPFFPE